MNIIEQLREQLANKVSEIEAKEKQIVEIKQSIETGLHQMKLKPEDSNNLKEEQKKAEDTKSDLEIQKLELELEITEIENQIAGEKHNIKQRLTTQISNKKNTKNEGSDSQMEFKIAQSLRQLTNGTLQATEAETVEGITRDSDVVYYEVDKVINQDFEEIPALQELVTVEKTTKGIVEFKTFEEGITRQGLYKEEELAANKEIAVPTVDTEIKKVDTYRGQTTVSQEAIMDESDENLEAIVQKELQLNSVVTRNRVITELFDEFASKTVKNITELKNAIITGVSGVHKPVLVINKSALAEITDLRYADGRFVFIQADKGDIDGYIFGLPVKSYDDTVLGGVGVPKALILGKNAILIKDRGQRGAGWFVNEHFGKRLGAYDRFVAHVQYPKGGLNLNLQIEPEAPVVPGE